MTVSVLDKVSLHPMQKVPANYARTFCSKEEEEEDQPLRDPAIIPLKKYRPRNI